jgi:tRNA threonylcarbamoyl adenosine modification protein YjeE
VTTERRITLADEHETRQLGARLARILTPGRLVLLQGDLGAGKTALARAIIQTLAGADIEVPSPTFVLAAPYDLPEFPLIHYDLYRLNDASETDELGLEDALEEGVALVEWPDILDSSLRRDAITIRLVGTTTRIAEMTGPTDFLEQFDDA